MGTWPSENVGATEALDELVPPRQLSIPDELVECHHVAQAVPEDDSWLALVIGARVIDAAHQPAEVGGVGLGCLAGHRGSVPQVTGRSKQGLSQSPSWYPSFVAQI